MDNNAPWWGPSKPLIVSDPNKLSYFARANMVRSGLNAGRTLNGANVAIEQFSGLSEAVNPTVNAADVRNSTGSGSADAWLERLGAGVGAFVSAMLPGQAAKAPTPPPLVQGPADNTVLGLPPAVAVIGGALLLGGVGYVVYKAVK